MTKFEPREKGTILSIAGKVDHLHIICTNSFFYKKTGARSVLAVNITSVKEHGMVDPACILHAGDHPFIKHDSYVRYKDPVIFKIEALLAKIEAKEITVLQDVTEEVFKQVIDGFNKSEVVSGKIRKIVKEYCSKAQT